MDVKDKIGFVEFVFRENIDHFESIDSTKEWLIEHFKTIMETDIHVGDCIGVPSTCLICNLEGMLLEYNQYYFSEDKSDWIEYWKELKS